MLDARAAFLAYCRLELGLAGNTIAAYKRDLALVYAALSGLALDVTQCGPDEIGRLLAWLRDERKLASSSLVRLLVALRMYARWLVGEKLMERDRIQLAQMPKLWNVLPEVLSVDEVERLLHAVCFTAQSVEIAWRDIGALSVQPNTRVWTHTVMARLGEERSLEGRTRMTWNLIPNRLDGADARNVANFSAPFFAPRKLFI